MPQADSIKPGYDTQLHHACHEQDSSKRASGGSSNAYVSTCHAVHDSQEASPELQGVVWSIPEHVIEYDLRSGPVKTEKAE